MAIIKVTYDDCANHGLEHSWKYFRIEPAVYCGTINSVMTLVTEVEEKDFGECKSTSKEVSRRICRNCKVIETKKEEVKETWIRKATKMGEG